MNVEWFAIHFHSCVNMIMHYVDVYDCCRTARGDCSGTALSFVTVKDLPLLEAVKQTLSQGCCMYWLYAVSTHY